jgi:hypothetical protein
MTQLCPLLKRLINDLKTLKENLRLETAYQVINTAIALLMWSVGYKGVNYIQS